MTSIHVLKSTGLIQNAELRALALQLHFQAQLYLLTYSSLPLLALSNTSPAIIQVTKRIIISHSQTTSVSFLPGNSNYFIDGKVDAQKWRFRKLSPTQNPSQQGLMVE
jgi:hypothetical protein